MPLGSTRDAAQTLLGSRREIGALGTASRLLVGLLAVALPIALAGFTWWDALGAFVLLPAVVTIVARLITSGYQGTAPEATHRSHAVCSPLACWLGGTAVAATVVFSVLTPADGNVFVWVWLGGSMLLAAALGYGGCEVLAAPNLLTGHRDEIGCMIFGPVDRTEAGRNANLNRRESRR